MFPISCYSSEAQTTIPSTMEPPCWLGIPPRAWSPKRLLHARNQIIHLPSLIEHGRLRIPATPQLFTPAAIDFGFNPLAPRPDLWLQFLDQVWPDDQSSIDTLQEMMGYCLTPDTSLQKISCLIGWTTAVGKGHGCPRAYQ